MIPTVCVLSLLLLSVGCYDLESYSQVATAGSGHEDGPKVFKALNMDLIFPKTFNSSENVISTTQRPGPQPVTEAVEALSSTADGQFTPERSSSETSAREPEPAVPANHSPSTFFNPEDNHADESEESEVSLPPSATGRAVDYRPVYPFSQLLTPNNKGYKPSAESYPLRSRPVPRPSTGAQRVVYPSYQASRIPSRAEIDKLSGKGQFSDRFSPSEAVASSAFKQTQTNRNRKPSISRPVGQPSNKVSSFVPTKDLYTFPPNLNSRYPSPSDIKQASPSDTVSSYLPPAAGPLDTSKFVGPVSPDLLMDSKVTASKDMVDGGYQYNPPQTPLGPNLSGGGGYQYDAPQAPLSPSPYVPTGNDQFPPPSMDDGRMMDAGPPAPPMEDDNMMDNSPPPDEHDLDHDHDDHGHDDHHDYPHDMGGYGDDKEYPTPPPGYVEEHDDHDFHHHHHHHPDFDFSHGPYFHDHHHDYDHHYPDVSYDDYHDHHFHDHHPEPEITTMAPPPPPPPPAPEQPRVKKYSYFYIGRKLWYIPLYFTLWFTFYVLWLILKSIARHKVNLPNHYVSRRSIEDLNHREAREAIDKLTAKEIITPYYNDIQTNNPRFEPNSIAQQLETEAPNIFDQETPNIFG